MKPLVLLLIFASSAAAAAPPAGRDVGIIAFEAPAKATYLLPHVQVQRYCCCTCASRGESWEWVAGQLSAAGISALTMDNRGFGESGGPRFDPGKPEVQRQLNEKWPGDFDAAFAWLAAQPGVATAASD